GEVFLGRSMTQRREVSDETNKQIDMEVRKIVDHAYETAKSVLIAHSDQLHIMAEALMKYETIDDKQIKEIMGGKIPSAPEGWDNALSARENTAPKKPIPAEESSSPVSEQTDSV
ncbi:MAG: cell division protein, partial [uncultured bacterium]